MRRALGRWSAVGLLAALAAAAAATQASDGPTAWTAVVAGIAQLQQDFHRELIDALRALSESASVSAAWALIVASFLYGVFHAAGPGHGKAVISTYLLATDQDLRRGIALSAASSLFQGVVAVALVYGLIALAGWLPRDTTTAVSWSERASYALVVLLGMFLAWRGVRALIRRARARASARDAGYGDASHDHGAHDHGACGHVHGPSVTELRRASSLREMAGIVLSVGLRPCTGAVLVLVFARAADLAWAGLAAVAAMSVGTALTVSALAVAAVKARSLVVSYGDHRSSAWAAVLDAVAIIGGAILVLLGISLLKTSLLPAHPLGLG